MSTTITTPTLFRTIERYPGYRFGEDGSIWTSLRRNGSFAYAPSDRWRKMVPSKNAAGYLIVNLRCNDGTIHRCLGVHRLILEAFKGPCPDGCEARHFPDGDRTNNRITNLIWGTRSENFLDKWQQGTMPHGEDHHQSVLTCESVRQIKALLAEGKTLAVIGKQFGVSKQTISSIAKGRTWQWLT